MAEEKTDFIMKDKENSEKDSKEKTETKDKSTQQDSETTHLPAINFPTFVISLNASALMNLGAIEDPTTGKRSKNLPMAKQTIDILTMLDEKTRGNLTEEEEKIMKNVLYDLRIIYVKETQ